MFGNVEASMIGHGGLTIGPHSIRRLRGEARAFVSPRKSEPGAAGESEGSEEEEEQGVRALPECWLSCDAEVIDMNQIAHTVVVKGFLRFAFRMQEVPTVQSLCEALGISSGWNYGVELPETDGFIRPINTEYMFFGSRTEGRPMMPQIFSDPSADDGGGVLVVNYSFQCELPFRPQPLYFPFDSQFLALRLNVRRHVWNVLASVPDWIPPQTVFVAPPLQCRLSNTMSSAWSLKGAFVDLVEAKPCFYIDLRRRSRYWIVNFLLPALILTLASACPTRVDASDLGTRLKLQIALWMGVFGMRYVIALSRPPSVTLTILDKATNAAVVAPFAGIGAHVLAHWVPSAAVAIDVCFATLVLGGCALWYGLWVPVTVWRARRHRAVMRPWDSAETREEIHGEEATKLVITSHSHAARQLTGGSALLLAEAGRKGRQTALGLKGP